MKVQFYAHLTKHSTEHGALPRGSPQPLAGAGERQEASRFTIVTSPQLFLQSGTTWSPPDSQGLSCIVWCWPAVGPFLYFHFTFRIWPKLGTCRGSLIRRIQHTQKKQIMFVGFVLTVQLLPFSFILCLLIDFQFHNRGRGGVFKDGAGWDLPGGWDFDGMACINVVTALYFLLFCGMNSNARVILHTVSKHTVSIQNPISNKIYIILHMTPIQCNLHSTFNNRYSIVTKQHCRIMDADIDPSWANQWWY